MNTPIMDAAGASFSKFNDIVDIFISHFKRILSPTMEDVTSDLQHIDPHG